MHVIATDLDRTLLPNGKQPYDCSMGLFKKIVKNEKLRLIYVSGRNLKLFNEAKKKFRIPLPDYLIGDVGTKIFKKKGDRLVEDKGWIKVVASATKKWDTIKFREELSKIKELRLQEKFKQNKFKLGYYIDNTKNAASVVMGARRAIKKICKYATVIYSVDETCNTGLLDILPKHATKATGLEYLRKKLELKKENIIYCGDSGNDILPLTLGYKAILVRNSIKEVRNAVKKELIRKKAINNLYIAKGYKKLNGYYVSGVIEGLIKFGIIPPKWV